MLMPCFDDLVVFGGEVFVQALELRSDLLPLFDFGGVYLALPDLKKPIDGIIFASFSLYSYKW